MEIWKDIINYEGVYQISDTGKVKSLVRPYRRTERILKSRIRKDGYVDIKLNNSRQLVHILVAKAFIPNPENKPEVNHKDGIKINNYYKNLEWNTEKENTKHASQNNLRASQKGINNPASKLNEKIVKEIRKIYKPKNTIYGARALAKRFNVSLGTIEGVIYNKTWKHLL